MNTISIVIATYNRAKLIKSCLEKLLKMGSIFEIIIVDDASVDETEKVIKSIQNKKIKYFKNKHNLGIQKSYFNGLKKASGDYVTFLADDDEYIDKNFFDKISKYDEDIISAKKETILNGIIVKNSFFSKKNILTSIEALEIFYQFAFGGNSVFRREILDKVMQFKFKHDFSSVFFLLIFAKKIRFINEVVFRWELNLEGDSFSAKLLNNPYKLLKWDISFIDEITPVLKEKNLYEEYKWFINKRIFEIFENVEFNYNLTRKEQLFEKLLKNIDRNVYIYGYGQVGVFLKKFLEDKGIKVLGFIDDNKNVLKVNEIDRTKEVIIATFKRSLIHKIYKKLIINGVHYKNIKELI